MSPRRYSSPLREAEAARTRARIVSAAGVRFARDGYAATTMKAIAEEAGVSVQSVHLAGSKSALLIAAFELSFAGDEGEHSLSERPQMADIMARESVDDVLAGWLDYVAAANARTAGLSRAMVTAGEVDETAAAAVADLNRRRRRDMRLAAGWAVSRRLLAEQAAEQAADEISFVIGPEAYDFFVVQAGWSQRRYRAWLEVAMRGLMGRWAEALS
ncbi:TetR/AcrR family transcriptional regulator [Microbacterium sp. 18062]|uniref:TetR/AcrR family transcriptional regulator n=1 Tax=Microbacterium sp. 18062 TaxID=2681410 RepID=UPI00135986FC|nr:helix-turn-helix domain-containing protein [Microbacterium sp. 18062]